jgi:hypothetical protein
MPLTIRPAGPDGHRWSLVPAGTPRPPACPRAAQLHRGFADSWTVGPAGPVRHRGEPPLPKRRVADDLPSSPARWPRIVLDFARRRDADAQGHDEAQPPRSQVERTGFRVGRVTKVSTPPLLGTTRMTGQTASQGPRCELGSTLRRTTALKSPLSVARFPPEGPRFGGNSWGDEAIAGMARAFGNVLCAPRGVHQRR